MQREAKISTYFLAAYGAVCLLLLSLPLSAPVQALKAGIVYVLDPAVFVGEKSQERLAQLPSRIRELILADQENHVLQDKLSQELWLEDNVKQLTMENQRLRSLLSLRAPRGWTPLWTQVIERDPVNWYHSFLVDAGQDDGVVLDDPVLGPSMSGLAVVGRVIEVRPRSSVVLLLTDELSSIASDISSGTVEGLAQGQGGPGLVLSYLPPDAQPQEGETVYTSPSSAVFPGNIPVGTVAKVRPSDAFLAVKSADVSPAASLDSLSNVVILIRAASNFDRAARTGAK